MYAHTVYIDSVSTDALSLDSTIVYTVPANTRAKWVMTYMSNTTSSPISNVAMTIVDGMDIPVIGSKQLSAGEYLLFENSAYVILEAGYKVKARADSAGVCCVMTFEETQGLVKRNG